MLRLRTIIVATSLVALGACSSDGGGGSDAASGDTVSGDTSDSDTANSDTSNSDTGGSQSATVPSDYPQLSTGEGIKVAAVFDGASIELVTDDALGRGYLPTYGIVVDETSGSRQLTIFNLWSLDVGTYSYAGLEVGLEDGATLFLSDACEEPSVTLEIVGGSAPGTIWGTIDATLCESGGSGVAVLSGRFTADAHESIEPDDGSCMGSAYCDFSATSDFSCTNDAPGCVWKPSICLGASDHPECRDWDGLSESLCESNTGCVYFNSSCEGDVVIPCETLDTELGCGMVNGCFWLSN